MKRKRKRNIKTETQIKRKPNIWIILLGVICIVVFTIIANSINDNRLVRMNGKLIKSPIVEISYSNKGGNSGDVEVDGKKLSIIALESDYEVGDSILVRYDKEKSLVVQERFDKAYFVLWFALDSILLIFGLLFLYAGIKGIRIH
jgi:hypothetical protein